MERHRKEERKGEIDREKSRDREGRETEGERGGEIKRKRERERERGVRPQAVLILWRSAGSDNFFYILEGKTQNT